VERSIWSTTALRSLGTRSASGLVRSSDRQVRVVVGLPNDYQGYYDDYDMRSVTITVAYKVLE
jgi:hypothetical protein